MQFTNSQWLEAFVVSQGSLRFHGKEVLVACWWKHGLTMGLIPASREYFFGGHIRLIETMFGFFGPHGKFAVNEED